MTRFSSSAQTRRLQVLPVSTSTPADSRLRRLLYPVLLLAGQAAGLIVSTANSSYTPTELMHQLKTSHAKVIFVGGDLVKVAREGAKLAGLGDDVIYVMPDMAGNIKVERGLKSVERLRGKDGFKPVKIPAGELKSRIACECDLGGVAVASC